VQAEDIPMIQRKIPAVFMRGGTSKGVFFRASDLPTDPGQRDQILLRVIGSPDPYEKQIDGMGSATSSTSKVVLIGPSSRDDCDVDYLFGQVSIDKPVIDWSGNCGNLTSAVGPYAIAQGLLKAARDGTAVVRIWQANIQKRIISHVPMKDGEVVEDGDFKLDGVTFPAAEIRLEFLDPGGDSEEASTSGASTPDASASGGMFPTGNVVDHFDIPGFGKVTATLINAGNPTIFVDAESLGLRGDEMQASINGDAALLARCEALRAEAAVRMGLAASLAEATERRPHTPKLAFVAPPRPYVASSGRRVESSMIDLTARILSMGKLHHAMTGTGAVAIAVAAVIPGTVVNRLTAIRGSGEIRFGHPSGVTTVGAEAELRDGEWVVARVMISRSARRLMEGHVLVPASVS
jgi:probable AcnD-accessory protein PrpF